MSRLLIIAELHKIAKNITRITSSNASRVLPFKNENSSCLVSHFFGVRGLARQI